jgi:dimethyl sulfoxide reductase membrane subunit
MTTQVKSMGKFNDQPWLIAFAVLFVVGLIAWFVQFSHGMDVLGLGQAIVWGVYIATFFLMAGLASGLVILTALGDLDVLPGMKAYRRPLLLGAIASYVAAGFAILMDIGKPDRVLNILFSPNFKSMFVWDFYTLALSVILAAAYLWFGAKNKWLPIVAAIFATAVVVVEGWILSVSAGTPLWQDPLLPIVFFIDGLIAALALVLLVSKQVESAKLLRGILTALLAAIVVFSLIEFVTVSYGGSPDAKAGISLLWGGALTPLYWGALLFGIILPLILLAWAGENQTAVIVAAILAPLGVFMTKVAVLVAGQALPFMRPVATYMPTAVEVGGVIGIVALAGLLFVLGNRYVPMKAQA